MGYNNQYEKVERSAPFRRRARRYLLPFGKALVSLAALIYIADRNSRSIPLDARLVPVARPGADDFNSDTGWDPVAVDTEAAGLADVLATAYTVILGRNGI
jgi:hypothetical protein